MIEGNQRISGDGSREQAVGVSAESDEDEFFEDESEETHTEPEGPLRRRHKVTRRAKSFSCIVKRCRDRRTQAHLLFCQHHYRCVPEVLKNAIQVYYDPSAEKQSPEYLASARGALGFAVKEILQPPFNR